MTKSPWEQFTLRIPVQATVADIYQAWTTSAGIESWFLRKCIYFDENGNPLQWSNPIFQTLNEMTFDTSKKGLLDEFTHNQAFAYSIALNQPFLLFKNAITSRITYNSDGTIDEQSTFIDSTFNSLGFQTLAEDPNGNTYYFEYDCE